jgi:hypothetical protein
MLKTTLAIIVSIFILQNRMNAQLHVKNNGNVGIGISTPAEKLHVMGKELIESGTGDHLTLISNSTSPWVNMSFFRNGTRQGWLGLTPGNDFVINKDQPGGSIYLTPKAGTVIIESQIDGAIGAGLSLRNPIKAQTPGTAWNWTIYNMTSNYGNSLQFWAYDLAGCGNGLCQSNFSITDDGKVGIGITHPNYKLHVVGETWSQVYRTAAGNTYPDYVFEPSYQLPTLRELEEYIKQNHHLPEVPSQAEVKKDGINLGQQQEILLKKIEELTLYAIEQDKKNREQNEKLLVLEKSMAALMEANNILQEKLLTVELQKKK